ncbi:hypothetical protein QR685DRAFT_572036 [Neurospora intermedia]|uniref:Secreted protein n=1 Tax=Neurospora intermedia TaxID=5142 RepID=A0ABR3DE93_NEUIN
MFFGQLLLPQTGFTVVFCVFYVFDTTTVKTPSLDRGIDSYEPLRRPSTRSPPQQAPSRLPFVQSSLN